MPRWTIECIQDAAIGYAFALKYHLIMVPFSRSCSIGNTTKFFVFLLVLGCSHAMALEDSICDDLAASACERSGLNDGTGESKSIDDKINFVYGYAEQSKRFLYERFSMVLADPTNAYFRKLALGWSGLKKEASCQSSSSTEKLKCSKELISRLTGLAQRKVLGSKWSAEIPDASMESTSYVVEHPAFESVVRAYFAKTKSDVANPGLVKLIENKIFPDVQALIIQRLGELEMTDAQRTVMTKKINSIKFKGTQCQPDPKLRISSNTLDALLIPNASYFPESNTFKYCAGLLFGNSSIFRIVSVMTHELTHAVDPCSISLGQEDVAIRYKPTKDINQLDAQYPLKNLISCLRDKRSINAVNFTPKLVSLVKQISDPQSKKRSATGLDKIWEKLWGEKKADRVESLSFFVPVVEEDEKDFCKYDQIGESMSDWMAGEVVPNYIEANYKLSTEQYINGYKNIGRHIYCKGKEEGVDVHPRNADRINKVMLVNPKIRKQMGCPSSHPTTIYCDGLRLPASPGSSITNTSAPTRSRGTGAKQ